MRRVWMTWGLWGSWIATLACGGEPGDSSGEDGGPTTPIECGALVCEAHEICIERSTGPFTSSRPTEYSCAATPDGCNAAFLCDCEIADDKWKGEPVVGCSILGGRTLYVRDMSCGDARPCSDAQACVIPGRPLGAIEGTPRCEPLPSGCEVSLDFCGTDCPERLVESFGGQSAGCASSDQGVGVYVSE